MAVGNSMKIFQNEAVYHRKGKRTIFLYRIIISIQQLIDEPSECNDIAMQILSVVNKSLQWSLN